MKLCRHCGADIKYIRTVKGWLHAGPLAELRVSRRELQDVLADRPQFHRELHRQTVLHPAQPE